MKKMNRLKTVLVLAVLLMLGLAVQAQDALPVDSLIGADDMAALEAMASDGELGLHDQLKNKFVEGDPKYMSLVAFVLVLGLALCVERIIYLTLSEINTKKLLADIEIYVDRIASMQIDTLNATVDVARQEILNKYQPAEDDIYLKTLAAAHVEEDEYFSHRIHKDIDGIIRDLRENHKTDPSTAPETTVAEDIRKELEAAAKFSGSDQERQARIFCSQLGINYDNLYPEEFAALVNILKKSKFLKSPLSKRGKTGTKKRKR